jgi:histidyl-tRNA synthetase
VGKQLKYADRKGFALALIAGETEFAQGVWQLKDLRAGTQTTLPEADLAQAIHAALQQAPAKPAG